MLHVWHAGACFDGTIWNFPGAIGSYSATTPVLATPYGFQSNYTCNSSSNYVVLGTNADTARFITCLWVGSSYRWSNTTGVYTPADVCARKRSHFE